MGLVMIMHKVTPEGIRKLREFMRLFGVFVLSDAIPFLGWIDNNGYKKAMKKTASEIDTLVAGWLGNTKEKEL